MAPRHEGLEWTNIGARDAVRVVVQGQFTPNACISDASHFYLRVLCLFWNELGDYVRPASSASSHLAPLRTLRVGLVP